MIVNAFYPPELVHPDNHPEHPCRRRTDNPEEATVRHTDRNRQTDRQTDRQLTSAVFL